MDLQCDWPCWEIMNCDNSKKCRAKIHPETPCWEIAREMSDYRHVMQICPDCIVHMLKGKNSSLSHKERQSIMVQKANNILTMDECLAAF